MLSGRLRPIRDRYKNDSPEGAMFGCSTSEREDSYENLSDIDTSVGSSKDIPGWEIIEQPNMALCRV